MGEERKALKKKKPQYTTLQNMRYILKQWWVWDKKGMALAYLRSPVSVGISLLGIMLPKLVLDCVTQGTGIREFVSLLAGLCLGLLVLQALDKFIAEGKLFTIGLSNRLRYIFLIGEKSVDTDFPNMESSEGQKKLTKATEFVYANRSGAEAVLHSLTAIGTDCLGLILYAGLIVRIHPVFLPLLVLMSLFIYLANFAVNRYEYRMRDKAGVLEQKLWYLVDKPSDFLAGKDLRLYKINLWFNSLFTDFLADKSELNAKVHFRWLGAEGLQAVLNFLRDGLCYILLINMVLERRLTAPDFTLYFGAVTGFSAWLNDLTGQLGKLSGFSLQCCDYREFMDMPDTFVRKGGKSVPLQPGQPVEIVFDHVSFRYPDGGEGDEKKRDTLQDVSFTIRPGEKMALVGTNGAGKTTCIKLLCGLYHPTSGRILINGRDITECNRDEYYQLFSAVFQEAVFGPFSIAQNVASANNGVDREKVNRCLEMAGLRERIERLPKGMDSLLNKELNEEAVELSGGEKQKLLLARALYKNAPVILLDEPTAALDPIAENELYLKYGELTEGRTSLYISHRLSSTRFCDRILFLDNGRIVEEGNHEELLTAQGPYAHMYEVQSHYYRQKQEEGGEEVEEWL